MSACGAARARDILTLLGAALLTVGNGHGDAKVPRYLVTYLPTYPICCLAFVSVFVFLIADARGGWVSAVGHGTYRSDYWNSPNCLSRDVGLGWIRGAFAARTMGHSRLTGLDRKGKFLCYIRVLGVAGRLSL